MKALSHRKQQKGAVLVLVTIALFTLLGFTALALDGGYLLLNKTRVQDAVDSAALSGAKTLNLKDKNENTHDKARDAVEDTLREILNGPGFKQVNVDLNNLATELDIEFSINPVPFEPTTDTAARSIRVRLNTVPVDQFLSQLVVDTWQVRASAVAATSSEKDDAQIIPLLMCAESTSDEEIGSGNFGFETANWDGTGNSGDIIVIKRSAKKEDNPLDPGNFLGLDFKCFENDLSADCSGDPNGGGGSLYKHALSGKLFQNSYVSIEDSVTTLPGGRVGPSEGGVNTRFNKFDADMGSYEPQGVAGTSSSSAWYYPDCKLPPYMATGGQPVEFSDNDFAAIPGDSPGSIVLSPGPKYDQLEKYGDYVNAPDANYDFCENERRIVSVPVADCSNPLYKDEVHGKTKFEIIGLSCFFLNQEVTGKGNTQYIVAEKIHCGPNDNGFNGGGSERIVLYDDTDSGDS
ncbi:hypothetical protein HNR62_000067 [Oceanisphaera litoralis]|uniref:TadE/TadG family type IV pilus assembly protein n=1 Tax=Oceanisphaera litoralis TaxID=225144 RepID=UPI00195B9D3A|nr:TadE/TadG family type IV pilus assembly protein [Oceanisphaera litoralis]MBM7454243.1 hypothetical protein [Oceanisphaera litoralis]